MQNTISCSHTSSFAFSFSRTVYDSSIIVFSIFFPPLFCPPSEKEMEKKRTQTQKKHSMNFKILVSYKWFYSCRMSSFVAFKEKFFFFSNNEQWAVLVARGTLRKWKRKKLWEEKLFCFDKWVSLIEISFNMLCLFGMLRGEFWWWFLKKGWDWIV